MNGHTLALDPVRSRAALCNRIARGVLAYARRHHMSLADAVDRLAAELQCTAADVRALYTKPSRMPPLGHRTGLVAVSRAWPDPIRLTDW